MALDTLSDRRAAIFLSASIPTPDRDRRYFESADVIAIRDCIKALVAVAVPRFTIVWGGHPSITPMIRLIAESSKEDVSDRFVLYQSSIFKTIAPRDNKYFRNVIWVDESINLEESMRSLRNRMLQEQKYVASVFVGGMEGVEEEFNQFREWNPQAALFPVASTGGASKSLYQEWATRLKLPSSLIDEPAYPYMWRQLLSKIPGDC